MNANDAFSLGKTEERIFTEQMTLKMYKFLPLSPSSHKRPVGLILG